MSANELAAELSEHLAAYRHLFDEVVEGQRKFTHSMPSHWDLRALVSLLHDVYGGAERIFERIARKLDKHVPSGSESHRELLRQMSEPQPGLRPAVISLDTYGLLDEFRAFRHVLRHAYAFELDWERMQPLMEKAPGTMEAVFKDVKRFIAFLRSYDTDS